MDKRAGLFIGLSIVVFVLWWVFILPHTMPKAPPPKAPAAVPDGTGETTAKPPEEAIEPETAVEKHAVQPPIILETLRYRIVFTNEGAGIKSLVLRYPDADEGVLFLAPRDSKRPHFALRWLDGPDKIDSIPWKVVESDNEACTVTYGLLLSNGVRITKKFAVDPERHVLRMTVFLEGEAVQGEVQEDGSRKVQLELLALNGFEPDRSSDRKSIYRHEQYLLGFDCREKDVTYWRISSVEKGAAKLREAQRSGDPEEIADAEESLSVRYRPEDGVSNDWFGLKNRYFTAVVSPISDAARGRLESVWFRPWSAEAMKLAGGQKNITTSARFAPIAVADRPVQLTFSAYLGPLDGEMLRQEGPPGSLELVDYGSGCTGGCFLMTLIAAPILAVVNLLAPLILWLLNLFGGLVGNYGVGIIFTTLLIRICLVLLQKKVHVTSFRMQQLAPKIKILKERYKDDQQKFSQELMRTYRENKVNPFSTFLPAFIQMPIFIGMYSVFERSLVLRRTPFAFWIGDLSLPDMLLGPWDTISINILFKVLVIDGFNLLPILMVITWFVQFYVAPRSPDPQMQRQQKFLMYFMPSLFLLFCYDLASGLSLYMFTNSLLAIVETRLIKRFFVKPLQAASSS